MEVLEKPQVSALPKRKLNYEDFARLTPPGSGNYELHNGQIIFMPSPTPPHQRSVKRISRRMDDFVEANRLGEVLFAPMDTKLFEHDTTQPDVLFVSKERSHIVGAKKIEGAPDLVVEVLSEGNTKQEMDYKKAIYAASLVKEYWVVDMKKQTVTTYLNRKGEFEKHLECRVGEIVRSEILPGFSMPVKDIFVHVDSHA